MRDHKTAAAIDALRAELSPKLERMENLLNKLLVERPSRRRQAEMAGVSRVTLWRRERKIELQRMVNGH